jgi:hypothetical protein
MSKKVIKGGKAKKQVEEKRYFTAVLVTIGGLFAIGLAAVVLFGGNFSLIDGQGGGHDSQLVAEMESKHGDAWRELGFTRWEYRSDMTMFYGDSTGIYRKPVEELEKIMDQVGQEVGRLVGQHGGSASGLYIMFHDERDVMYGTYSGTEGAQIQR